MTSVFVLQHAHALPDGRVEEKFIGVYSSSKSAIAAIDRLKTQPGFSENPRLVVDSITASEEQGFYIDEYDLDVDHWTEGFVTVDAGGCELRKN